MAPSVARAAVRSRLQGAVRQVLVELLEPVHEELLALRDDNRDLRIRLDRAKSLAAANFDNLPALRQRLLAARETPAHGSVFEEHTPLISVRVATYNRSDLLLHRAIPSVLAQTYENFELIIVGDGCTDDTEQRVAEVGDSRVRFVAMPRGVYPADPVQRWMVAGSPAMNEGAQQARGQWIAPLDDDDKFTEDHLQVLLDAARAGRYEMVYGKFRYHLPQISADVGLYPPERGQFGFQTALYMSALRFFEWEPRAWLLDEPADWNLCRRMFESGVRIGFVDRVVTELWPAGPRLEG